jgi:hypothetical protein
MMLAALSASAAVHQFGLWVVLLVVVVAIAMVLEALAKLAGKEIPEGRSRMFWIAVGACFAVLVIFFLISLV